MNAADSKSSSQPGIDPEDPRPEAPATPELADAGEIDRLFAALGRPDLPGPARSLMSAKLTKKAKKLVEEATEVAIDALIGRRKGVVNESVDVLYHMAVLWHACGVTPQEVWQEMQRRAKRHGVAGKLPKRAKKKAGQPPDSAPAA